RGGGYRLAGRDRDRGRSPDLAGLAGNRAARPGRVRDRRGAARRAAPRGQVPGERADRAGRGRDRPGRSHSARAARAGGAVWRIPAILRRAPAPPGHRHRPDDPAARRDLSHDQRRRAGASAARRHPARGDYPRGAAAQFPERPGRAPAAGRDLPLSPLRADAEGLSGRGEERDARGFRRALRREARGRRRRGCRYPQPDRGRVGGGDAGPGRPRRADRAGRARLAARSVERGRARRQDGDRRDDPAGHGPDAVQAHPRAGRGGGRSRGGHRSAPVAGRDRVRRVEDFALVCGQGRFADDLPVRPGTLHAAILRAPVAHAEIISIDTSACGACVLTGEEVRARSRPFPAAVKTEMPQWSLAVGRVRYAGEPVAIAAAATRALAEDALEAIAVDYRVLPVVTDPRAAPIVHERRFRYGDPEAAFAAAPHRVSIATEYPRNAGVPIECFVVMAEYLPGEGAYEVFANFQGP